MVVPIAAPSTRDLWDASCRSKLVYSKWPNPLVYSKRWSQEDKNQMPKNVYPFSAARNPYVHGSDTETDDGDQDGEDVQWRTDGANVSVSFRRTAYLCPPRQQAPSRQEEEQRAIWKPRCRRSWRSTSRWRRASELRGPHRVALAEASRRRKGRRWYRIMMSRSPWCFKSSTINSWVFSFRRVFFYVLPSIFCIWVTQTE